MAHIYHRHRVTRLLGPQEALDLYVEPGRQPVPAARPAQVLMGYTVFADADYREVICECGTCSTSTPTP